MARVTPSPDAVRDAVARVCARPADFDGHDCITRLCELLCEFGFPDYRDDWNTGSRAELEAQLESCGGVLGIVSAGLEARGWVRAAAPVPLAIGLVERRGQRRPAVSDGKVWYFRTPRGFGVTAVADPVWVPPGG